MMIASQIYHFKRCLKRVMIIRYVINVNGTVKSVYLVAPSYWIFQTTPCTRMDTHVRCKHQEFNFFKTYFHNC